MYTNFDQAWSEKEKNSTNLTRFLYSKKKDPSHLLKTFRRYRRFLEKDSILPVLSHEIEDEGTANRD